MESRLTSSGGFSQELQRWTLLHEIQADMQGKHITPENFRDRMIFMSMFNDIILDKRGNEDFLRSHVKEDQRVCIKI